MRVTSFTVKEIVMGAFDRGDDLLLSLKKLCKEQNIKAREPSPQKSHLDHDRQCDCP